jgi:hypothetical protein
MKQGHMFAEHVSGARKIIVVLVVCLHARFQASARILGRGAETELIIDAGNVFDVLLTGNFSSSHT